MTTVKTGPVTTRSDEANILILGSSAFMVPYSIRSAAQQMAAMKKALEDLRNSLGEEDLAEVLDYYKVQLPRSVLDALTGSNLHTADGLSHAVAEIAKATGVTRG